MLSLPGAIGVGAIVPVQTAINTRLRTDVRDPVVTALYSFLIGTGVLLPIAWLLTGQPLPDFSLLADAPAWAFIGGPLGVLFIVGNILLFPPVWLRRLADFAVALVGRSDRIRLDCHCARYRAGAFVGRKRARRIRDRVARIWCCYRHGLSNPNCSQRQAGCCD